LYGTLCDDVVSFMNVLDDLDDLRRVDCRVFDEGSLFGNYFRMNESNGGMSVIHLNIRSYKRNFDQLVVLLDGMNVKFDVIILSEAWMDSSDCVDCLDGYVSIITTKRINQNDGTVVYIRKENLSATCTEINVGGVKCLNLKCVKDKRKYDILAVYRNHSCDFELFINGLYDHYSRTKNDTTYVLVGDMNCDILDVGEDMIKNKYLDVLYEAGFVSCVNVPTRQTGRSSTCIDHIFVRHPDISNLFPAVLTTSITDHYITAIKINDFSPYKISGNLKTIKIIKEHLFRNALSQQSWETVISMNDVDRSSERLVSIFQTLQDEASVTHYEKKKYTKLKPWISIGLINSISQRDKLSRLLKRQPFNTQLRHYYLEYRKHLSKFLKITKALYYKNKVAESSGNPRKFWNIVNEVSGAKPRVDSFPINYFSDTSSSVTNDSILDVANKFNIFFANVGYNLANNIRQSNQMRSNVGRVMEYQRHDSVFVLRPVTELDLFQCVSGLRGGSAPGRDSILSKLVKKNIDLLATPLLHIINLCFSTGSFPKIFKVAKVTPIYKSGNKGNENSYRPISLLSVFSKIIEKCMKEQLVKYLKINNLISDKQFGFRDDKNTSNALYTLNSYLRQGLNDNKYILLLFIDLTKAFDSIDRNLLFDKLELIGVTGVALQLFKSYLSERTQVVNINGTESDLLNIDYGVVQGSTLGPVLFLIYIDELARINVGGDLLLYADDTAVCFRGDSWEEVYGLASNGLLLLKRWFDTNILSMNTQKTKVLPIFLRKGRAPPINLELKLHKCTGETDDVCSCEIIERVDSYKYLGIFLDCGLTWSKHIFYIKNRLRKMIYVFSQLRDCLNIHEIRKVYFAYVQSVFMYGIIAWGGTYRSFVDAITITQKAIIKVCLGVDRRFSSDLVFERFQVLNIRKLFIKSILIYCFKNKDVQVAALQHGYMTRSVSNNSIHIPRNRKTICDKNVSYLSLLILRNAPPYISDTSQCTLPKYKSRLMKWLSALSNPETDRLLRSIYTL
jgi:hypothetical protein